MPFRNRSRIVANQSRRFSEKRQRRVLVAFGLLIICIITVTYTFSRLSALPFFAIDSVQVFGADADVVPIIQSAALQSIEGDYLGLFSKSNAVIYPRSAVATAVKRSSARVEDVSMHTQGRHLLVISVSEKAPVALVCPEFPDLNDITSSNALKSCFLADKTGYIFSQSTASSSKAYNQYYIPSLADNPSSSESSIGQYATSTIEFTALQSFYDGAQQAGIAVQAILIKDDGEYEMYALNPKQNGSDTDTAVIYFNDAKGLSDQLVNLVSFWTYKLKKVATSTPDFEYIDLRYGSNIIYRTSK